MRHKTYSVASLSKRRCTFMGFLKGLFGNNSGVTEGETEMNGDALLFFFLILVIIFCNSGLFGDDMCSLLFFFLLLVLIFCNGFGI